jgi:hypothetical protein
MNELDFFALQIQGPMLWTESYEIRGMHEGNYTLIADGRPVKQFNQYWYIARCLICHNNETEQFSDQVAAKYQHFVHCCREHDYVFPGDAAKSFFQVDNQLLQDAIIASIEHDLPMPGFEDHSKCVKQHRDSKVVCVIHAGNEYKRKIWMGQY